MRARSWVFIIGLVLLLVLLAYTRSIKVHRDGYVSAGEEFLRQVYAAIEERIAVEAAPRPVEMDSLALSQLLSRELGSSIKAPSFLDVGDILISEARVLIPSESYLLVIYSDHCGVIGLDGAGHTRPLEARMLESWPHRRLGAEASGQKDQSETRE